jgi:hypothetical protein
MTPNKPIHIYDIKQRINNEYNNRFTITTLYDEKNMSPIYDITDTLTNKVKTIPLMSSPLSYSITVTTDEHIYNLLVEAINNIISDNRNNNIQSILKQ